MGVASNDRNTRLYIFEGNGASREVLVVNQHTAPVERVRFHPSQETLLCTAASDSTVRLFDVRSASQKNLGRIDVQQRSVADIAWSNILGSTMLAITERNNTVHLCDIRKVSQSAPASTKAKSGSTNSAIVKTISLDPSLAEACIFSPMGNHLVASTTNNGMGEVTVWEWEKENAKSYSYPGHTGPIYTLEFSPDGKRMATGASDAIVGIWDAPNMSCTHTISRCQKFTRSVAFSHDSQYLASSQEDSIDLALASTGELVGKIDLSGRNQRSSGGADEIAFHPKHHILACARCDSPVAVTVAKCSISKQ